MKLDDAILKKLADEDDMPDFVCPACGGAFFGRFNDEFECDTITDSFRCKWKGPESECLLPSRASLAEEILKLRRAVSAPTPAGEVQRDGTRLNRDAYEKLISEDVAWLLQQPRTLERDHVEVVLRWSIAQLFTTS